MYPHQRDRFRMIEVLFQDALRRAGLKQRELAERLSNRVSQATISHVCNLADSVDSPRKRVGREALLRIFVWGLGGKGRGKLSKPEVDALLWLYDGSPLIKQELFDYGSSRYSPEHLVPLRPNTTDLLQETILTWLGQITSGTRNHKTYSTRVEVFFNDAASMLQAEAKINEIESIPGHQMMIHRTPRTTAFPMEMLRNEKIVAENHPSWDAKDISQSQKYAILRTENFYQQIQEYGVRWILSKRGLTEYASPSLPWRLSFETRMIHLIGLLHLLNAYKGKFCVGLVDETPDLMVNIKSSKEAIIRGGPSWVEPEWGPSRFHFSDQRSVLSFLLGFERKWQQINVDDKNPLGVMRQISNVYQDGIRGVSEAGNHSGWSSRFPRWFRYHTLYKNVLPSV